MVCLRSMRTLALLAAALVHVSTTLTPVFAAKPLASVQYVVTGLKVVEAPTLEEALEKCQANAKYVTAGVDWTVSDGSRVVQLCHIKERVADVAAAQQQQQQQQQSKRKVLQRIAVYTSASSCPQGQQLLHAPRSATIVCAQFGSASTALATGAYVSDIAVTTARNYNNEVPGWETIPFSVNDGAAAASGNRGAFISFQRPVVPITALQVVHDVDAASVAQACSVLLGGDWEQAGQGFLDHAHDAKKSVLCLQRSALSTGASQQQQQQQKPQKQLLDVEVVKDTETCHSGFVSQALALENGFRVCTKWANRASSGAFVADLKLLRLTSTEVASLNGQPVIPGGFAPATPLDVNQGRENSVVFLVSRATKAAATQPPPAVAKPPLKARRTGDFVQGPARSLAFKIVQIADMHTTGNPAYPCRNVPAGMNASECTESVMTKFIGELLDLEKPDFVVYTGDNVEVLSPALQQIAMDTAVRGAEERGIPFAMVFGNHDDENGFSREAIVQIAASKKFSYVQRGPADVDGVGNYELSVQAPADGPWGAAGADVFRMYFLDSHGYPDRAKHPFVSASYDWVKQNQIDYYRQLSNAHASTKVPALMFFHIPLVEYASAAASKTNGERHEGIYSSDVSTNLFSTLVELNEVKATFVGHDHVNEYCYKREGIQLCYGGGVGFGRAYGGETFARRARVIEWSVDSANKRTIRSWKRHFGDLATRQLEEVLYSEAA